MPLTRIKSLGITDGTIAAADLASGVGGKVLQVVQTTKTDTFTTTSTSFVDVTGLSVSITPSSTSNKILVLVQISYGGSVNTYGGAKLIRGSTSIFEGTSDGASRTETTIPMTTSNEPNSEANKMYTGSIFYLDSPSTTSSTTYKIQIFTSSGTETLAVNRNGSDSNNNYNNRSTSSITVMEIAG
ncbi:hypothetical protein EB001_23410 [bacterium]|nr:hypothetical protein [bacterium]